MLEPPTRAPKTTSREVARRAGVSQSTVSRVFSARGPVAGATSQRVLHAAAQLGYRPNAIASSLITRRTNMIGLVMAEISSPFYPYVLEKLTQQLHEHGKRVLLFSTAPGKDVDDLLSDVLSYQVDGLIIGNAMLTSQLVEICTRSGIPLMLFNRTAQDSQAGAVCCDNVGGGRLVADLLLDAGHTRLAYIAGKPNTSTNRDREHGFATRLHERGYTQSIREQGAYTYETGYAAAQRLFARARPPDAIFCANDITALGALDAACDCGVSVPQHCSIIGFDDIPAAAWTSYNLTTIRQPVDAMVELSIQLLLAQIATPAHTPQTIQVPGELIVRRSARMRRA